MTSRRLIAQRSHAQGGDLDHRPRGAVPARDAGVDSGHVEELFDDTTRSLES